MSARPGPGGGYHAEWYPYRDRQLSSEALRYHFGWLGATMKSPYIKSSQVPKTLCNAYSQVGLAVKE
jgi:hypothetical protein